MEPTPAAAEGEPEMRLDAPWPRHRVLSRGEVAVEVRPGFKPDAGPGWVTSGYVARVANAVGTTSSGIPANARMTAASVALGVTLRPRIPEELADDLEALGRAPAKERVGIMTKIIADNPELFRSACGRTLGFIRSLALGPRGEIQTALWNGCDFGRLRLVNEHALAGEITTVAMLYVALDRQGGVLDVERQLLRDFAAGSPVSYASYAEQRDALRIASGEEPPRSGAPQDSDLPDPPPGVVATTYPSDGRALNAWLWLPQGKPAKRPALLYLPGGFAWTPDDFAATQSFRDAGFVVMTPTFRGQNGNGGSFEMFLGEVDDAAAAVRWLAARPEVDGAHVYAFGHAAGGAVASLLPLLDGLPLAHSGSVDGLMLETSFERLASIAPFDVVDHVETAARVLLGHTDEMQHTHYAWLGRDGSLASVFAAVKDPTRLGLGVVDDDPRADALGRYLACIQWGRCPADPSP